jgi:hypothetical protein
MPITTELLALYDHYSGDEDTLSRHGTAREKLVAPHADWTRITELLQALALVSAQLASEEFKRSTLQAVHDACQDAEAERLLLKLSEPGT